jgi:threonine dehydrogenase-like Zn-dependent dehydrogenase
MKAAAVIPGKKNSLKVIDVEKPVPKDNEVLVKVLRAGIDGTDIDIYEGKYGEAPQGSEYLILGHEAIGIVEGKGRQVKCLSVGDIVVPTVRRPCPECCYACVDHEPDMCLTGDYRERGIKGIDGYMTEYYVEQVDYVTHIPPAIKEVAVMLEPLSVTEKGIEEILKMQERLWWNPKKALVMGSGTLGLMGTLILRDIGLDVCTIATRTKKSLKAQIVEECGGRYVNTKEEPLKTLPEKYGPFDIIIEATGVSSLAMEASQLVNRDGVVCLFGVYTRDREEKVNIDQFNLNLVFDNKAIFGSVSSNRRHFERGVDRMLSLEKKWPGVLGRFFTKRVTLDSVTEGLGHNPNDIKVMVEIAR